MISYIEQQCEVFRLKISIKNLVPFQWISLKKKKDNMSIKKTFDFIPLIVFHCASLKGIISDRNGHFGLTIIILLLHLYQHWLGLKTKCYSFNCRRNEKIIGKQFINRLVKYQHMQFHIYISILSKVKSAQTENFELYWCIPVIKDLI